MKYPKSIHFYRDTFIFLEWREEFRFMWKETYDRLASYIVKTEISTISEKINFSIYFDKIFFAQLMRIIC